MSQTTWLLIEAPDWRLIKATANLQHETRDFSGRPAAKDLGRLLREEMGYGGEDVFIALSAESCLTAHFKSSSSTNLKTPHSLLYAMEEFLPISAEQLTADAIYGADWAFGVATVTDRWGAFIDELQAEDISIRTLTPHVLLITSHVLRSNADIELLILKQHGQFQIVRVVEGLAASWQVAHDMTQVRQFVELMTPQGGQLGHIATIGEVPLIASQFVRNTEHFEIDPDIFAVRECVELCHSGDRTWIDLRNGQLGESDRLRPIRTLVYAAACSLMAFLIAVACTLHYRVTKYNTVVSENSRQQVQFFQVALPDQPVPAGIVSRLESEVALLDASITELSKVPKTDSAVDGFARLILAFPNDVRCRIDRVEVDGRTLSISGTAKEVDDISEIRKSLDASGFDVAAPTTTKSVEGFSFRMSAVLSPHDRNADTRSAIKK